MTEEHSNNASFYKNMPSGEVVEIFFRKHYASLCQGVYRLLRDESLAEDLVQEVFIKVWEKKDKLTFDDRFIFYLKKSCYHAALAYLSGKNYLNDTDNPPILSDKNETDDHILQAELEKSIQLAISKLPEKTCLVFTLSRYEEMTYKEIASELNISVKAVEKHMGIALRRLKDALKEHLISFILLYFL